MTNPVDGIREVWRAAASGEAPRRGLSLGRIVEAAVEIADAYGLAAVSMAHVAEQLGFTTMSLYRHVGSKEELVLHMQDAAMGWPDDVLDPGAADGWRDGLERWARAATAGLRAHPWIMQAIPMFGLPATPNQLAWLDRGLGTMADLPLHEGEKLMIMLLVDSHVLGDMLFRAADSPSTTLAVEPQRYGALLAELLDPERYPSLARVIDAGVFDGAGEEGAEEATAEADPDYDFRLARVLDGIERFVEDRLAGSR
ncbi:TetR/AcrR family transcriptional regulator [Euzebya sp.]|uniref:TetR/AcrR family transcriptional regulator n=1 Tax=Euzebya sp. TaxID=1971409 RepID=UPI0035149C8D